MPNQEREVPFEAELTQHFRQALTELDRRISTEAVERLRLDLVTMLTRVFDERIETLRQLSALSQDPFLWLQQGWLFHRTQPFQVTQPEYPFELQASSGHRENLLQIGAEGRTSWHLPHGRYRLYIWAEPLPPEEKPK